MTNMCKCTEELKVKQNENKSKIHLLLLLSFFHIIVLFPHYYDSHNTVIFEHEKKNDNKRTYIWLKLGLSTI